MHKIVIESFPNNRIVLLPQNVNIESEKERDKTFSVFSKHKKLLFIARDQLSLDEIRSIVPGINSLLFPDTVTYLIGTFDGNDFKNRVLFIIRDDNEMIR